MGDNDIDQPRYEIGYKKPPSHTRFKRGTSGNAKGRPKGSRNFATVFEQELKARIEVTENGKRKRISKREAIAKQTVNRAAAGDYKATATLLNEARLQETQNQFPLAQTLTVGTEDQMVMDNILKRIRQSQTPCFDGSLLEPPGENSPATPTQPIPGGGI
ncbi:MAG TPA: DUF5681 domain-containing protein [Candidatus Sulfotelmatobacter sp.]